MSALKWIYIHTEWDMSFGTKNEKAFGFQSLGVVGILSGRLLSHPPLLLGNTIIFLGLALWEWRAEEWNQVCGSVRDGLYRAPQPSSSLRLIHPQLSRPPQSPYCRPISPPGLAASLKTGRNMRIHHPLLVLIPEVKAAEAWGKEPQQALRLRVFSEKDNK